MRAATKMHLHSRSRWYRPGLGGLFCAAVVTALGLTGHALRPAAAPQPQGYAEVFRHADLIVNAATLEGVPAISVAAGVMNQGNAVTRPFGTDLLERVQLAAPFKSTVTGTASSVGIAQLTPNEIGTYIRECSRECLFRPALAVQAMAAKLGAANRLLPSSLNPTDRLMVLALAQNSGPGAATAYLARGGNWRRIYHDHLTGHTHGLYDNDQLRKILANVRFLEEQGFQLPPGVNLARWQQIVDMQGRSVTGQGLRSWLR
jgi:hypothetical protein